MTEVTALIRDRDFLHRLNFDTVRCLSQSTLEARFPWLGTTAVDTGSEMKLPPSVKQERLAHLEDTISHLLGPEKRLGNSRMRRTRIRESQSYFNALALTLLLSACHPQADPPQRLRMPIDSVDLVLVRQAVIQSVDVARGCLGENSDVEVLDCRALCIPTKFDCDSNPVAMCGVQVRAIFPSTDPLEMRANLMFYIFVDTLNMTVFGNFLSSCSAEFENCHISIPWGDAVRLARDSCLDNPRQEVLAGLRWDDQVQKIVWQVSSVDGVPIATVWAQGAGETFCNFPSQP